MIAVEKPRAKKSFLTTKPFGPWDIGNVEDIQHFVRILVALTLKGNLVVVEAICKGDQELEEADTNLRDTIPTLAIGNQHQKSKRSPTS